jgi:DNA-binding MurR/RpiR family transcriptional regulator
MAGHPIAELVRQRSTELSPAERRLAKVLLSSYPIAGLETLARLAERAAVSPPTVTRFIGKLGFRGYPEFQDRLRQEVQDRLSSPLARYDAGPSGGRSSSALDPSFDAFRRGLAATLDLISEREFGEVATLLSDRRHRVLVLGGRVSSVLARYLAGQLHLLRPGVRLLDPERTAPVGELIDLRRRDVLVAFDYRRYQADTVQSGRAASERGATVVLFTDPWLSPASVYARHTLVTSVEAAAPFDSMVGAVAVIESLVAAVLSRLGQQAQLRMRRLEELRKTPPGPP